MKTLVKMLIRHFTATKYASNADILGMKSGGIRDSNKVDWRQGGTVT